MNAILEAKPVKAKKAKAAPKDNATNTIYKVRLTFTEHLLGTAPKDKSIYKSYIASKLADMPEEQVNDEVASLGEQEEKCWTGFHLQDGKPVLLDYMIKGFMKDACSMLHRANGSASSKVKAYKKIIDGLIFVSPRNIPIALSGKMGVLERPLRCSTPQGERVALTRSDYAPAGSTIDLTLTVLGDDVSEVLLEEWLNYGALRGLGQWRNGSYGRYTWVYVE